MKTCNFTNKLNTKSEDVNLPNHILKSIIYIHKNYMDNISLTTLSEKQYLNKCYLCQLFKEHTSMTVSEFINKVRLEKSTYFLKNTDDSILLIAMSIGFNNVTYFNKLFKKEYGITPLQYRKTV